MARGATCDDGPHRPSQPPAVRALRRSAAARGDRPRAHLPADNPLRRRADGQSRLEDERRDPQLLRRSVDSYGQTTVMVTHEPRAAAIADRVLFLADGLIVREMHHATAPQVLDVMAGLGE